jgi:hypothetical protein
VCAAKLLIQNSLVKIKRKLPYLKKVK